MLIRYLLLYIFITCSPIPLYVLIYSLVYFFSSCLPFVTQIRRVLSPLPTTVRAKTLIGRSSAHTSFVISRRLDVDSLKLLVMQDLLDSETHNIRWVGPFSAPFKTTTYVALVDHLALSVCAFHRFGLFVCKLNVFPLHPNSKSVTFRPLRLRFIKIVFFSINVYIIVANSCDSWHSFRGSYPVCSVYTHESDPSRSNFASVPFPSSKVETSKSTMRRCKLGDGALHSSIVYTNYLRTVVIQLLTPINAMASGSLQWFTLFHWCVRSLSLQHIVPSICMCDAQMQAQWW